MMMIINWERAVRLLVVVLAILACGCGAPDPASGRNLDPELEAAIAQIRAIDHHAHPVALPQGGQPDRDFDALPVDNMEPASDPVFLRPGEAGVITAWRALFGYPFSDADERHMEELRSRRRQAAEQQGASYPEWVLDRMGVAVMLANRVTMGAGIRPPRFLWVPYADALLFPLDNSGLAAVNSDRKAFFADEDRLLRRYLEEAGLPAPPAGLSEYLARVVTPTLEAHKRGGAVAEKFEAAYLRSLAFEPVDRQTAERVYARFARHGVPPAADYKQVQDYLFRYIAMECGRLGMAVHIHTMAGAGSYFAVNGVHPMLLESVLNDPALRKTTFVMVHGGWPYTREITPLLSKPNAYLDYSAQSLLLPPAMLARSLREWLEWVPEKVMFGTDAYPYTEQLGWEESGWLAAHRGREALTIALTGMVRDREITRERGLELARMVLRENARKLYGLSLK